MPNAGGYIGGAVGGTLGGGIGGTVGASVGTWIQNRIQSIFGGSPTPIHERIQHRFDEHPAAAWDVDYLAPKLRALRECGLGNCNDNNLDRWFMDNIVGYFNDVVLVRANDIGTVDAFNSAIAEFDASIQHHGPGHPDWNRDEKNRLLLPTIVDYLEHLKQVSINAIQFINSGGSPSTPSGGSPSGGAPPPMPTPPGQPQVSMATIGVIAGIGLFLAVIMRGR